MGDAVVVGESTGSVASVSDGAVSLASLPEGAREAAGDAEWFYPATVSIDLPDGVYDAEVTLRSYHPVALLFAQE